ncbi:hypothetical protein EUGRSUZ_L01566 [Eucalyptus grandis]|uniref:Uncharacterized protein n=1 Tax=Eucalyptus grandis TaxID=71139 RepID=A0A058ZSS4_EUCGR|nr:hypothetical protein EUGRSUZ_L01566 [Eucalyptus grandis]
MVLKSSGAGGWRRSKKRNGRDFRERSRDARHRRQGGEHCWQARKWWQSSLGQCWLCGGQRWQCGLRQSCWDGRHWWHGDLW